jgi:hypothetical protein
MLLRRALAAGHFAANKHKAIWMTAHQQLVGIDMGKNLKSDRLAKKSAVPPDNLLVIPLRGIALMR